MDFITKEDFIERYKSEVLPDLMACEVQRLNYLSRIKKQLVCNFIVLLPLLFFYSLYKISTLYWFKYYYYADVFMKKLDENFIATITGLSLILSIAFLPKTVRLLCNEDFKLGIKTMFFNRILSILGQIKWEQKEKYKKKFFAEREDCIKGNFGDVTFVIQEYIDHSTRHKTYFTIIEIDLKKDFNKDLLNSEGLREITNRIKKSYVTSLVYYKKCGEKVEIKIKCARNFFEICNIKVPVNSLFFVENLYDKLHIIKDLVNFLIEKEKRCTL